MTLLLARTTRFQKIKRNGVFIELFGKKIWFIDDKTVFNIGKEIYIRYDPAELDTVRVYYKETNKYLWTYYRADYLNVPYAAKGEEGRNKIAIAMSHIARKKAIKEAAKAYIACKHHEKILIELAESKSRIAYTINTRIIFLCSS